MDAAARSDIADPSLAPAGRAADPLGRQALARPEPARARAALRRGAPRAGGSPSSSTSRRRRRTWRRCSRTPARRSSPPARTRARRRTRSARRSSRAGSRCTRATAPRGRVRRPPARGRGHRAGDRRRRRRRADGADRRAPARGGRRPRRRDRGDDDGRRPAAGDGRRPDKLTFPAIAANDAYCKHLFDNRYGTGQSTLAAIDRLTNLTFPGREFCIVGYGWVGKGLARAARGAGGRVTVVEIDPVAALEAHMDGHRVGVAGAGAARRGRADRGDRRDRLRPRARRSCT